jgi:deoxycytidylate deaminase
VYALPHDLYPSESRWLCEGITQAVNAARRSTCSKDQRGAAVWHHTYGAMVAASNGPPAPCICDGSDACRAACGKVAVHAEERALLRYLQGGGGGGLACRGMTVLHIRVVNGEPVASGPPSCVTCSRTLLAAGASNIWLWHDEGWKSYAADAFHFASLSHQKHGLPVITSPRS